MATAIHPSKDCIISCHALRTYANAATFRVRQVPVFSQVGRQTDLRRARDTITIPFMLCGIAWWERVDGVADEGPSETPAERSPRSACVTQIPHLSKNALKNEQPHL